LILLDLGLPSASVRSFFMVL